MDIMGSWFNEMQYIKMSNKEDTSTVKFRLVFRLRYAYEMIQQFLDKVKESYVDFERRLSSAYDPDMKVEVEMVQFSKVFKSKSSRTLHSSLNISDFGFSKEIPLNIVNLLYYECLYNFLKLRYQMHPMDFIQLMALKLRVDFGKFKPSKEKYIATNFKAIFPILSKKVNETLKKQLLESVLSVYREIAISAVEAMKRFVHCSGKFDNYFQEMYPLRLFERDDQKNENFYRFPEKCYIGLASRGISIYDEDFNEHASFTFKDILKWGYSEALFILIIEELEEDFPVKISFKTRMASNIVYSLNSICNLKKGKMPEENQLQMNRNVTREITENKFFKRVSKFPVCSYFID